MWTIHEIVNEKALRLGVRISEYKIVNDVGEFMRCVDGTEWITDKLTVAKKVCDDANRLLGD